MKYQKLLIILVMVAMVSPEWLQVCFGGEVEQVRNVDRDVAHLEESWSKCSANFNYAQAQKIVYLIKSNHSGTNINSSANKLLKNLLSKEVVVSEVGVADISVMKELALFIINSKDKITHDQRQNNAEILLLYLGKIRKELIKDYIEKPVFANVLPPAGVPGMAGMSPAAIEDPVARKKYEAALKENEDNNIFNKRQYNLDMLEYNMRRPIMEYMIEAFRAGDSSPDVVAKSIKDTILNDQEKAEVLRRVARK